MVQDPQIELDVPSDPQVGGSTAADFSSKEASAPLDSSSEVGFYKSLFEAQSKAFHYGKFQLVIPETTDRFRQFPGMAYHFKPELFIQLGGSTLFQFPYGEKELKAGQVCIMPRGVLHGETALHHSGKFENVVICFYNRILTVHTAHATEMKEPKADKILFFRSDIFDDCIHILDRVALLNSIHLPGSDYAVRGLMSAFFGLLLNMLESDVSNASKQHHLIHHCQWLIRTQLNDPSLSVSYLAEKLGCSPNYLSKLFHQNVHEKITSYINGTRLRNAVHILETTTLSVKEIAYASGFRDPNYFSRIFKQRYDCSPNEYRVKLLKPKPHEKKPKVVFSDHVEYDFGLKS